jgi:hypothetical protein
MLDLEMSVSLCPQAKSVELQEISFKTALFSLCPKAKSVELQEISFKTALFLNLCTQDKKFCLRVLSTVNSM